MSATDDVRKLLDAILIRCREGGSGVLPAIDALGSNALEILEILEEEQQPAQSDVIPAPGPEPTHWWCGNCVAAGLVPAPEECPNCQVGRIHTGTAAAMEAFEVSKLWGIWPEQGTAIVLFVKTRGVDHGDAVDRAEAAVSSALGFPGLAKIPADHRGNRLPGCYVEVTRIEPLGRAAGEGLIQLLPGKRAFR